MKDIDIPALEIIAARAWPALREGRIGDWRLYATSGFSNRINACWPSGDPGRDTAAAIEAVEAWYADRGLPPLFKVVETAADALNEALLRRGYVPRNETLTMAAPISNGDPDPAIRWADSIMPSAFAETSAGDCGDTRERLEALARVPPPRGFASLLMSDRPAALGGVAVDRDWAGIFAMRTAHAHRRRGLARRILTALTNFAVDHGATHAYLQVEAANAGAISLYASKGFETAYRYVYWSR